MPIRTYDNGWYRINGMCRNGRKNTHYFFNDKPIHVIKHGLFKEEPDLTKRYLSAGRQCKICISILKAYSTIGLENRLI